MAIEFNPFNKQWEAKFDCCCCKGKVADFAKDKTILVKLYGLDKRIACINRGRKG